MSKSVRYNDGGGLFFGLLTILFIGLKLAGIIAWSWWWVLAPLWIPAVIVLVILVALLLVTNPNR